MLFAGKKHSELKSIRVEDLACPKCNRRNTTQVSVFGTYKHLLQIPFFQGKKYGQSVCQHCNHTIMLDEMSDAIKLAYYELKETVKTPIWFFMGLIVIKTLVLIKIFSKYF